MKLKRLFRFTDHNWLAILFFNFKMLPFKQAIKLPFDFYFKVRFNDLSGRVILNCSKLRRGMFQWGFMEYEIFPNKECILSIKGTLIINAGTIVFGNGTTLLINKNAILELDEGLLVAPRTKIIVHEMIKIGSNVYVGWESQLFDTDIHYVRNTITQEIKRITDPVCIGTHCWIGNRVSICKGTKIPDYCIVASNSICDKDYSELSKYTTIAGVPAKQVGSGSELVFESLEPELVNELLIRDEINIV